MYSRPRLRGSTSHLGQTLKTSNLSLVFKNVINNDFCHIDKKSHAWRRNVIDEHVVQKFTKRHFIQLFYVLVSFFSFTMVFNVFITTALTCYNASLLYIFHYLIQYNLFL